MISEVSSKELSSYKLSDFPIFFVLHCICLIFVTVSVSYPAFLVISRFFWLKLGFQLLTLFYLFEFIGLNVQAKFLYEVVRGWAICACVVCSVPSKNCMVGRS